MNKATHYEALSRKMQARVAIPFWVNAEMIEKVITHMHSMAEKIRVKSVKQTMADLLHDQGQHWFRHYFWDSYPEGPTEAAKNKARKMFPSYYITPFDQ